MKTKTHTHTHTLKKHSFSIVNSICSWKISGFLLGNLRLCVDIFDSLWTSSVVLRISLAVCGSRRKSSETSTLGRRVITRM